MPPVIKMETTVSTVTSARSRATSIAVPIRLMSAAIQLSKSVRVASELMSGSPALK